jgi:hypothetical protein
MLHVFLPSAHYLPCKIHNLRAHVSQQSRLHVAYIPFNSAQFPYHSNNRVTAPFNLHAASQPHVKTQARLFHRPDREPTWTSFNIRSPRLPLYLPYIYIYMRPFQLYLVGRNGSGSGAKSRCELGKGAGWGARGLGKEEE